MSVANKLGFDDSSGALAHGEEDAGAFPVAEEGVEDFREFDSTADQEEKGEIPQEEPTPEQEQLAQAVDKMGAGEIEDAESSIDGQPCDACGAVIENGQCPNDQCHNYIPAAHAVDDDAESSAPAGPPGPEEFGSTEGTCSACCLFRAEPRPSDPTEPNTCVRTRTVVDPQGSCENYRM